ncbi:NAD(P)-dependent alcohol dehydrogenase [Aspergillus clavatus NRRL 1]|uniref:Zinc-dependent alcohol dehydrogenase, putative n=1 Tax=Aspergillus clavatus (strain ATCC 1007 / CBS 513.65 / DSM 816 / NCTC 3887 / NRRL 1 / QM 1276 / 107) TaxID=344612 RepID=A1CP24_ASPCL|nr:zinc-dependent alcohol dehydrogenase, putative [Aspergillus clavatus NRRL 1]EAW07395.1 zinc-dependent alcohol dehydrogenase, putative [Aspergillus clavatus NRRL 1]
MTSTQALVLHGAKDLRLESRSISPPTGSDVQVAIRATGLCGSDLHYYSHGRNGDFVVREPMCLGHESSGTVTAVGPDVTTLQVGDRVALEVGLPCRNCTLCRTGRYNICANMKFRSSAKSFPHLDGTLMELTNHPAEMCHKLPDTVSYAGGALVEPLAVCLHAIRRSHPPTPAEVELARSLGDSSAALIFGAGAIGLLLAAALATSQPFTSIVVADIDPARLRIAESLNLGLQTHLLPKGDPAHPPPPATAPNADHVAHALQSAQRTAAALKNALGVGAGFVRVYDCTGVPACVQAGIYAAAPGAVLVQIGMGNPVQTLPVGAAALREVDIIGVFRYDGLAYPAAIELVASGKLDHVEKQVVTHRVKLEEGERAFSLAGKGVDEEGRPVVKVVIES